MSIVLKCLFLARIGRPDILWSVKKLARALKKNGQTKTSDKLLARVISYFHHTCEFKHYCHVGNIAQQFRSGSFQDSDFAGDLEDSKSTTGGTLCIFGSHTFVPISGMCKKQTSVSHSSTESKIISTQVYAWMETAVDLWDLVIELCHSAPNLINKTKDQKTQGNLSQNTKLHVKKKQIPTKHINLDLDNNDHVSSNARSSRFGATLYVFEDNEAVIKMIIKGRSPTMRHVPRTHRVALDWLFERINQDPKIEIRNIDTKHQQEDILTERNFTRDEWNSLVNFFNVKPFQLSAALRLSA